MLYSRIRQNNTLHKADQLKEGSRAKGITRIVRIGVIVLLFIFFLEFWIINRLSTYGDKIAAIKKMESNLQLENQMLENNIAYENSLRSISEKARWLGFESPKNIEYIK